MRVPRKRLLPLLAAAFFGLCLSKMTLLSTQGTLQAAPPVIFKTANVAALADGVRPPINGLAVDPNSPLVYMTGEQAQLSVVSGTQFLYSVDLPSRPTGVAVEPKNGLLYIPNEQGSVTVVQGRKAIADLTVPGFAIGAVADPRNGLAYVAVGGDTGRVQVYSNATLLSSHIVSEAPRSIALNNGTGYVYVGLRRNQVAIFHDGNPVITTTVETVPEAILTDPHSGFAYVTQNGGSPLTVFQDGELLGTLDLPAFPGGVAVDPTTGEAFVIDLGERVIHVIRGLQQIDTLDVIPANQTPLAIGSDYTGNIYMLTARIGSQSAEGTALVIQGRQVVGQIAVGSLPRLLIANPPTGYVYIANRGDGSVNVLRGSAVVGILPRKAQPVDAAYSLAYGLIYVANGVGTTSVSVLRHGQVVGEIAVARNPVRVIPAGQGDQIYVTHQDSPLVTVIRGLSVAGQVHLDGNVLALAVNSKTGQAYAVEEGKPRLVIIRDRQVEGYLTLPENPTGIYAGASEGDFTVTYGSERGVSLLSNGEVVGSACAGSQPATALANPGAGYGYVVGCAGSEKLGVLQGTRVITELTAFPQVWATASNSLSGLSFVAGPAPTTLGRFYLTILSGKELLENRLSTAQVVAMAPHPLFPETYLLNTRGREMIALDGRDEFARVSVGPKPAALAVDPQASQIYVADQLQGSVYVIQRSGEGQPQLYFPFIAKAK